MNCYLKELDLNMGKDVYEMYQDIPAKESGSTNDCFGLSFDEFPKYLEKNNIPYDSIITKSNDKYMYLDDVDYFIDDAIRNCEDALEKTNTKVIMMETSKTKDYENNKIDFLRNSRCLFFTSKYGIL